MTWLVGRLGLLVLGAAVSMLNGCSWSCDGNVEGVHQDDHFVTTVVGPAPDPSMRLAPGTATNCGDLGDLPAGATIEWKAALSRPEEACEDQYSATVTKSSSVTLGSGSKGTTLPNGCTGYWLVAFRANNPGKPDLTTGNALMERSFIGDDATKCPPVTVGGGCSDVFVVTVARH
jgi:hypothetical protein